MPRRVTILPARNVVIMDGSLFNVDCSSLPSQWRQVEWFGEEGTIETKAGEVAKDTDTTSFREVLTDAHLKWSKAEISRCAKGEPEPGGKA